MITETKKKILLITIPALFYCIKYGPKPLVNKIPDEEIISVVRVIEYPYQANGGPLEIGLPQENIGMFEDLINGLNYKKRFNFWQCLYIVDDRFHYAITYDNYTVELRVHGLAVCDSNGGLIINMQLDGIQPYRKVDAIEKLFFEK